jgi:protein phosphatase
MGWASDVGRVREGNEDTVKVDPSRGLAIIADGMGGHRAGEIASSLAAETIFSSLAESAPPGSFDPAKALSDALLAAHLAIQRAGALDASRRGMGTTVVIAWAAAESVWIAHVGDSRAYLLSENAATLLTEDHTVLNQIKKSGQLPADPSHWPPRGILSQALGMASPIAPQIDRIDLAEGSRILLCSDGLTDMLDDREIGDLARTRDDLHDACAALVAAANERGGRDNISVVLIQRRPE